MDRNLALEAVRVTEAAAVAASRLMGRGDERAADKAAVDAMFDALMDLAIDGTVVVGEGSRDEAPVLYVGQKVGTGQGPKLEIAIDPLEGPTITAKGGNNALSVIAMAEEGGFLTVPDVYMEKIAVGGDLPAGVVDLDATPEENLRNLAKAKGGDVCDLRVCILDRPRHEEVIGLVREAGAHVILISDGDVSSVIATARTYAEVDMYMGIGGAPQGVLAAAALRCVGGQMQGRLMLRGEDEKSRARKCGITDFTRKYDINDMARGTLMVAATGVTLGAALQGVRHHRSGAVTHSLVMRSKTGTVRYIQAHHNFARKGNAGSAA